jgi:transposase
MKLHGNARLTPRGRKLLVERVCSRDVSLQTAALSAGVSTRTASKWVARYRAEGELGLLDRSSAPHRVPGRTPEARVVTIAALRRLRFTAAEIAEVLGMALSTVSAVLLRIGLGKRSRLEPPEPPNRYERQRPGELIHIDVKKLGRIDKIGHRISGSKASQDARSHWGNHDGSAGSTSTSASTTPHGLPTSRCSTTRKATPQPASYAEPWPFTPATASPSNAS